MAEPSVAAGVRLNDAAGPHGMRLYAIGDVHGRLDLLREMHARIDEEIARDGPADWRIVHVGDYIDRGPWSSGVLEMLIARMRLTPRVVCLLGNHDLGLLHFLDNPAAESLFARHGGVATAASYGVKADVADDAGAADTALALRSAIPAAHLDFIRALPRSVSYGDFFFCHAGIRPGVPLDRQDPEDLIWIRQAFLASPRLHERVVVHGHTPAATPEILPNRVNIDTGAWQTGILTALAIDGTAKRLLQVSTERDV